MGKNVFRHNFYTEKTFLISCNEKTIANHEYKFKLEVDKIEEKLYLCVYNIDNELIEKESFVYLKSIEEHLTLKLNRLAVVYASTKSVSGEKYFRYYKIDIYNLISYKKFIELLKTGIIDVSLIERISKSGKDTGRYRNKNLVFNIKKQNIEKLFHKFYSFDSDLAEVINYNE